ncbi:hypothetical protein CVT24_010418 [Panaeolus cyanescens]|uniref:DNA-directed DNA polymerase n=1 Tax=Panaeolus cyanescens TaxID=181874 RepID=A0A409YPN0_9AGAR|nr:hypothetical protein CVT24_010418 [Panaeolus cyanescens]
MSGEPSTSSLLPPRSSTTIYPLSKATPSFVIDQHKKTYKYQYSNIYFIRLKHLREPVEDNAFLKWKGISGNPVLVPRVLDVEKGRLCYIIGTVYMDMPLKPNVLIDIARDQSIPPPPPLAKFCSDEDQTMLEDESGRIRLVGPTIDAAKLVTGVIIGALGMETPNGDFEVVDICYAGMAPQIPPDEAGEETMNIDDTKTSGAEDEWIAAISGLDVGSPAAGAQIQMLAEYLSGEGGDMGVPAAQISRLIIAGNSLTAAASLTIDSVQDEAPKDRQFTDIGNISLHPIHTLSSALEDVASIMPIHVLPGELDPSGTILPQQPFPRAMFGDAAKYPTFICETNPTYLILGTNPESQPARPRIRRTLLINSGQPLNDMFKYLKSPPNTRLSVLESTLRWRHMAPTAPDTLWCHPYLSEDPFIINETPHIYIVGDQKKFATKLVVQNPQSRNEHAVKCRIVALPVFSKTGEFALINLRTLEVKCQKFTVFNLSGAQEDTVMQVEQELPSTMPLQMTQDSLPESSMEY